MLYNFDAVSYANTGKRLKKYQCGDVTITKNADGGLTFSSGQSSVILSADEVRGRGIKNTVVNDSGNLIVTYTDNETVDLGLIKGKNAEIKDRTRKRI